MPTRRCLLVRSAGLLLAPRRCCGVGTETPGLAQSGGTHRRAGGRGRTDGHRRPCPRRPTLENLGSSGCSRKQGRRRHQPRQRNGRARRSRRLYCVVCDLLARSQSKSLPLAQLRSACGFAAGLAHFPISAFHVRTELLAGQLSSLSSLLSLSSPALPPLWRLHRSVRLALNWAVTRRSFVDCPARSQRERRARR